MMFSRKWLLTTLLVISACAVMVRLGVWQLDRLEQRRAFNARVLEQKAQPVLILDRDSLSKDLFEMEYRSVIVTGEFDNLESVLLRNQVYAGRPGYRLFTPLKIEGTSVAVMIDRGFVPSEDYDVKDWEQYALTGPVEINGTIRRGQTEPDFGGRPDPVLPPGERLQVWNIANIERMNEQIAYDLIPVYIQVDSMGEETGQGVTYPVPHSKELELTEGPHLGYAFQWFLFAAILILGYPVFIKRESVRGE